MGVQVKRIAASISILGALLAGCATYTPAPAPAVHGQDIAERRCATCHAVAMTDASPRADAPPLRDLYKRYAIEDLRRAFLEGVHVGPSDMPTFHLDGREVDALLVYLRTLDPCSQMSSDQEAMDRCFSPL